MSTATTLLACIALPLLAPLLITALHRWPNPREAVTLLTAAGLLLLVLSLYGSLQGGAMPVVLVAEPLPGLAIAFELEPLGMLFALLASFLWLVTSVYSIGYMRSHHEKQQTSFYSYFAIALGERHGHRLCRQPVHAVHFLRGADAVDLPAGHACRHPRPHATAVASTSAICWAAPSCCCCWHWCGPGR